jgi:hypothetical protein
VIELKHPLELSVTVNLDTPAVATDLLSKTGIVLPLPIITQGWLVPHDYRRVLAEVTVASLIFDHLTALQIRALRLLPVGQAIKDDWLTIDPTGQVKLVRDWFEATLNGGPSPRSDMPPRPSDPDQWRGIALEVLSIDLMSPAEVRAQWTVRATAAAALITALTAVGTLALDAARYARSPQDPQQIALVLHSPSQGISPSVEATLTPDAKILRDSIVNSILGRDEHVAITQLQTHLAILGFYKGAIDGKVGPATYSAVEQFGRIHRLDTRDWRRENFVYYLATVAVLHYNPQTSHITP